MLVHVFKKSLLMLGAVFTLSSCQIGVQNTKARQLSVTDEKSRKYKVGEIFDDFINNGGMQVKLIMTDNSSSILNKEEFTYEIHDSQGSSYNGTNRFNKSGNYVVTISKDSLPSIEHSIKVIENQNTKAELVKIEASSYSETVLQGETYSFDGVVTANYSDNTTIDVTEKCNYSSISTSTIGSKTLNISYIEAGKTVSTSITVQVISKPVENIKVTSLSLDNTLINLTVGSTSKINPTVLPANATNKNLTWSSNNTAVATVSNGLVTANGVGTATITAATTDDSNKKATATITVTAPVIDVTGITLNRSSLDIQPGQTSQLVATIFPSNASDKAVVWSGAIFGIGISSSGLLTIANDTPVGTETTIVASAHGNSSIMATCKVKVVAKGGSSGWLNSINIGDSVAISVNNENIELSSIDNSSTTVYGKGESYSEMPNGYYPLTIEEGYTSSTYSFKDKNNKYLSWTSGNSLNVSSTKDANSSWNVTFDSNSVATITNSMDSTRELLWNVSAARFAAYVGKTIGLSFKAIRFYGLVSVPATNVSISPSSLELNQGGSRTLSVDYLPIGATSGKEVTWSSNSPYVSVDQTGRVTVSSSAPIGTIATITVQLNSDPTKTSTCSIKVTEKPVSEKAAWTIMLYLCGSSLEYDYGDDDGYASDDLREILSSNLPISPDDPSEKINVIIQTGGIVTNGKWYLESYYLDGATKISATNTQRWEVKGNKLSLIKTNSTSTISSSSEFTSFLNWGLDNYEADRYGVILWDHGGGIGGCCNDEASDGYLKNSDIASSASSALSRKSMDKFDFIAYDCCLMGCADIASVNADYFKYMVGSQESEYAGGYDYDVVLDYLQEDPIGISTDSLCDKIAQTFLQEQCYDEDNCQNCFQTNAVYDLSKMNKLIEDFNSFSAQLNIDSSYKFSTMCTNVFEKALPFGSDSDGSLFGLCDFADLIKKLGAKYGITYSDLINDISNVVTHNYYCVKYRTKPCGMNGFVAHAFNNTEYPIQITKSDYTGTLSSKFTTWQTMNLNYGDFYRNK